MSEKVVPAKDVTFIEITNVQIYEELLKTEEKIRSLEIKVYGIISGLMAALGFLIRQEFFPGG